MVVAGEYLHSRGTEKWDFFYFFLYITSTNCYNIHTKLNQCSNNGGSGGIFILTELRDRILFI